MLNRYPAQILFFCVLTLCALGYVMLSSAVSTTAASSLSSGGMAPIMKTQAIWLGIGIVVFIISAHASPTHVIRLALPVFFLCVVLLSLCYVDGVGKSIKGARRWVDIGGFTFQPSELAKLSLILFLAWWHQKFLHKNKTFFLGFVLPAGIASILVLLVLFQKDVGTAALMFATMIIVMFVAGTRVRYLALLCVVALLGLGFLVLNDPVRVRRLTSHIESQEQQSALEAGYQQRQSIIALGSGGVEGLGLERSLQKQFYLPEAHTDFIFAIIGEELGLRFTLLVVGCFSLIAVCGLSIASQSKCNSHALLATGIVASLCFQAFINIGVVTSLLPNKGLPLPFISYGGSNLVVALGMVGILISISRVMPRFARPGQETEFGSEHLKHEKQATA
jgi:cell division protein FtsW